MPLNELGHADDRGHGPGVPPPGVKLTRQRYSKHKPDLHPHNVALHLKLVAAGLPGITWLGSPNFTPGRNGSGCDSGVQHTTVGTAAAATARFQSAAAQVSAHYLAREDGGLNQYVALTDGAWGAGEWTANMRAIQLEREDSGNYNRPLSDNPAQAQAIAIWWQHLSDLGYFALVHQFPGGLVGHKEVPGSSTACPDGINVDELIALAQAGGGTVAPPGPIVTPYKAIPFKVYDSATNDRSWRNWPDGSFRLNEIANPGDQGLWTNATQMADGKWIVQVSGSNKALEDDCIDDTAQGDADGHPGAYSPPDYVAGPPPPAPAPAPVPTPAPTPTPAPLPVPPGGLLEQLVARVGTLEGKTAAVEGRATATEGITATLVSWAKGVGLK